MSDLNGNKTPLVSILIVAFRSSDFIAECLLGVRRSAANTPHEILLIDNGDDGTEALVRAQFPEVRIVPSEGNIGFGAGNNRLAAQARAPRLLLINPDALPHGAAIDDLVEFARAHPEAAAWGGRSLSPDGTLDAANFLVLPRMWDFLKAPLGSLRSLASGGLPAGATAPGYVDVLSGGFMMVRADIWRELGGFDESFFLYSEEIDLFKRMKDLGHRAIVTPHVAVVHDAGGGEALSPTRFIYRTAGQMHYARKHFGGPGAFATACALWLVAARYVAGAAIAAPLMPSRGERLRAVGRGWRGVLLNPTKWWGGYRGRRQAG
ncbi:glycosyltransferase family 2 protein [Sphingomonas sp. JC676]|uniref:glycosyltransferase family 2 protein n=1 Tax=Sphingomonas sp. JC676 TaxID=2768065 RepID=UPI0016583FDD|nr:glycosyltransferase family 2 protein [Sphingomonas sp. JC676]MBC9032798.1 glycosyltransferase family 2 protein [Sphingomonas sp. JC676]